MLASGGPAWSQAPPPVPGRWLDVRSLDIPTFLATRSAVIANLEWSDGTRTVYLLGDMNFLTPGGRLLAPRLVYRDAHLDVVAGGQLLARATPFYDLMSIYGGRVSGSSGAWSWSLWGGETASPERLVTTGTDPHHALVGATVGYRPNAYTSWGVSAMPYAPTAGSPISRTVAVGQGYVSDRETWSVFAACGQDVGSGTTDTAPYTRRATRFIGGLSRGRFLVAADVLQVGRLFGPPQGIVDIRGQTVTSVVAQYRLTDQLSWIETFRVNGYETPGAVVSASNVTSALQHLLAWQVTPDTQIQAGVEDSLQSGAAPGGRPLHTQALYLQGSGRVNGPNSLILSGNARTQDAGASGEQLQLRLRGDLPVGGDTTVYAERYHFGRSGGNAPSSQTQQVRWGVQTLLDEGSGRVEYVTQSGRSGYMSVGGQYRLAGNLFIAASVGITRPFTADASLRWILGPNAELLLQNRTQSPGGSYLVNGLPTTIGNLTTLTFRASWGGPMEGRLRRELEGRVLVRVDARPAGGRGAHPLSGITVHLDDLKATTDVRGVATFSGVAAGRHRVRLSEGALGPNYDIEGGTSREISVPSGRTARVGFRATAYASVSAYAFSDPGGTGQPETPFTPYEGVQIQIDGEPPVATREDGYATFRRLTPGRHRVALRQESVGPAVVLTTPAVRDVECKAGDDTLVGFGLQGFAFVAGSARAVPRGQREPTQPLADIAVWVRGQPVGTTDANGDFRVRVPSGRGEMQLDPVVIGGNRYIVGAPIRLDLPAGGETRRDLVVAERAEIRGVVLERLARGETRPLREAAVPVLLNDGTRFAYTSADGTFRFRGLPMGRCVVRIDPASLPQGMTPAGPLRVDLDLASGEVASVRFIVSRAGTAAPR